MDQRPLAARPLRQDYEILAAKRENYGFGRPRPVRCWKQTYVHRNVFMSLNSLLRRRRRLVALVVAVLALSFAALTAHSALMGSDMGKMDTAAVCLAVGGCLAVVTVAAFGLRRMRQQPLWVIPAPVAAALTFIPASSGFLARAGPPPPLSQVFRL